MPWTAPNGEQYLFTWEDDSTGGTPLNAANLNLTEADLQSLALAVGESLAAYVDSNVTTLNSQINALTASLAGLGGKAPAVMPTFASTGSSSSGLTVVATGTAALTLSNMAATVSSSSVTVTVACTSAVQNVAFQQGSGGYTNVTPVNGIATFTATGLAVGTYTFTAIGYSGVGQTGTPTAASTVSATIAAAVAVPTVAVGGRPTLTVAAQVAGQVTVGDVITCNHGTWNGSPTQYQYRFYRGTGVWANAQTTTSTYTVAAGDVGTTLQGYVYASNAAGMSVFASATTDTLTTTIVQAAVSGGTLTLTSIAATVSGSTVTVAVHCTSDIENISLYDHGTTTKATADVTPVSGVATFTISNVASGSYSFDAEGFTVASGQPGGSFTPIVTSNTITVAGTSATNVLVGSNLSNVSTATAAVSLNASEVPSVRIDYDQFGASAASAMITYLQGRSPAVSVNLLFVDYTISAATVAAFVAANPGIVSVELGNETFYNYAGKSTTSALNESNAQALALQIKAVYQALPSTVKVLCQASDGGAWGNSCVGYMYAEVPSLHNYCAGWVCHPYGQIGTDSDPSVVLSALVTATSAAGAPANFPIYVTEYGIASDNGDTLIATFDGTTNYGRSLTLTYAQAATDLTATFDTLISDYPITAFYIFGDLDEQPHGTNVSQDDHFGISYITVANGTPTPKPSYAPAVAALVAGAATAPTVTFNPVNGSAPVAPTPGGGGLACTISFSEPMNPNSKAPFLLNVTTGAQIPISGWNSTFTTCLIANDGFGYDFVGGDGYWLIAPSGLQTAAGYTLPNNLVSAFTVAASASGFLPNGPSGTWGLRWNDEFTGTTLDSTHWSIVTSTSINGVTPAAANVAVSGGYLVLSLSSSSSGAAIVSGLNSHGAATPSAGVSLNVGDCCEARISIPGYTYSPGNDKAYNWPAFWAVGEQSPGWPVNGEIDIVEGLNDYSTGYHAGPSSNDDADSIDSGPIAGSWANAFHTFTAVRGSTNKIYWDGSLVYSYASADAGGAQSLILNVGYQTGNELQTGTASEMLVDYVRVWSPA